MNPLRQAIESAIASNDKIGEAFARLGTSESPNGFVVSAYRDANEALKLALKGDEPLRNALSITRSLRSVVSSGVRQEMTVMVDFGQTEANRQLGFYKEPAALVSPFDLREEINSAVDAVEQKIQAQEALLRAMILTDAEAELIVGTEEKKGILRDTDITVLAAGLIASFVWDGFLSVFDWYHSHVGRISFQKQAIAALDARTTETCLHVHGQIQNFDNPFRLTGRPRFADEMQFPAFHQWCRTSVVLYDARWEDGITQQMMNDAQYILSERASGRNPDFDPASALLT